ncbi:oxygen-independent coproporphyrinogen III oxidase [Spiribacter salinus M19-40]|uniref:Coproporphyrinogen-III oxidase n=1 Tax=Spiribacter salinus M19-40 TaxID=1260251 RepID=R4V9L4_9GAMM|nr:oxygen-independent coproporphyrinogen III oxidase [Spiribacter salinus]AGM41640.1 oxygen-independent coproporphyrinogen III oxidase [Spiribacter salinus M19-40]
MADRLPLERDLLRRYDVTGPRYTSYPTAAQFTEAFDAERYRQQVAWSNEDPMPRPLSLYVHVPFCRTVCFYCACNKVITANYRRAEQYLERLIDELDLQAALFDDDRPVEQLHLGGGTPTYFTDDDLARLITAINDRFPLAAPADREFSIEVDPRTVDRARIAQLAELGFNRLSLGVQDFDADVQKAINRIQGVQDTADVVAEARAQGFHSVNLDLMYGLPLQTPERLSRTLDAVLDIRPDRIALYNYAHMPEMFRIQRQIRDGSLPAAEEKLTLLIEAMQRLAGAGYRYIGMDHFALPGDELAQAAEDGTLHRNFQGYATRPDLDLIGLGASSIGQIGDAYSQNRRDPESHATAVSAGELPVWRGVELTADDRLRRDVIQSVMCQGTIDFEAVGERHGIVFNQYFGDALEALTPLVDDGLVTIGERSLQVTDRGQFFLRNVAMPFDAYLAEASNARRFSRVI